MKHLIFRNRQFLLYCIIGLSGTTLHSVIYSLLLKEGLLGYQGANIVGYASGTMLSFILNAKFNFRVNDRMAQRLACFFGVAFVGLTISAGLLRLLIGSFGFNRYLAIFPTLVVIMLVQYNLNRLFSFRKTV